MTLRFPVLFSETCWDRYRQHPDSSCQKVAAEGQTASAFATYLRWLERYLIEQKVADRGVWSALRSALRPYEHPLLHRLERRARRHGRQITNLLGKARSLSLARLERR
jgi:hypothetical protein